MMLQITFAATAATKRAAFRQLLSQREFDSPVWECRAALPRSKTRSWFNLVGEPSPGSDYKWWMEDATFRQARR